MRGVVGAFVAYGQGGRVVDCTDIVIAELRARGVDVSNENAPIGDRDAVLAALNKATLAFRVRVFWP